MFRQIDNSSTRAHAGLGIGPALVKHLVEEHQGRMLLLSEGVGRGCTFSVWIAQLSTSAPSPDVQPAIASGKLIALNPVAHKGQARASNVRVLLVDDSRDALEAFAMLLEIDGARVTQALGAQEAIAVAQRETVDLLISDIGMPNMDEYALARSLRSKNYTAQLPMVALTGFGRAVEIERAHAAGFDAHLTKPVSMLDVQSVLMRMFPN